MAQLSEWPADTPVLLLGAADCEAHHLDPALAQLFT
jgi:hypothetical protein